MNSTVSRRDFVKIGTTAGAAALFVPIRLPFNQPGSSETPAGEAAAGAKAKGMLIDTTKCIGCRSCERACKKVNGLPDSPPEDKEKLTRQDQFTVIQTKVARHQGRSQGRAAGQG